MNKMDLRINYSCNFFARYFLIAVLSGSVIQVKAQETDSEDLLGVSLEDLMNLKVTSASKKEENVFDAPSIVTAISAQEIERFGAQNILEVLERSTSFYGLSSVNFTKNAVGLRGDLPNHVNTHILFLIDGRPFKESVKGGQNVSILTTFPIASIEQIEIIRGAGSVLYGSNAYVGVVNIITKKPEETELIANASAGSFGTTQVQLNGSTNLKKLQIGGGLNILNSDGWQFADTVRLNGSTGQSGDTVRLNGSTGQFAEAQFSEEVIATNLRLSYDDFTFLGFFGRNNLGHITSITSEPDIYTSQRLFLDLGYSGDIIADKYNLTFNVTYNQIRDEFDNGLFNATTSTQSIEGDDYTIELTNFFTLNDQIDLTLGGAANFLSGEQGSGTGFSLEPYNTEWYNGYFQASYKPQEWLNFIVGGQLNKVPNADLNFVPRLALISSWKSGFGGKLLLGQAFRAPYGSETDISASPDVIGNPDLIPEMITTYEAQLFYTSDKGNIALTYFKSNQENLIKNVVSPDPEFRLTYANLGELKSSGLEFEGRYSLSKSIYVDGSYTFQTNEDGEGNEQVTRLPQHMLKIGVMYDISSIIKIAVHNAYYSSPFTNDGLQGLGELSSFNWMTAKADLNLNKILSFKYPLVGLNMRVVNVLDEEVYNPELIFGDYDAIQSHSGIAYQFGVKAKF